MAKRKSRTQPRVYSYIRFSTPEQAMGDSERRQIEDAKAWADRNNYEIDLSLNLTDRGLSGFHGDHRTKGALGKFLVKVESGGIPAGSILLVENIDRLSREGAVKVLREVIFKLWDHGITLHTLSPDESYPPGCETDPKFLALLIYIQRAQDESKQKSRRIRESRKSGRKAAREEGKILTSRAPAWLRVEGDKFVAIPEAAKMIRLIFDLKLKGLSIAAIERRLNDVGGWTPPQQRKSQRTGGWRDSYIKKILRNRAAIGEFQPFEKVNGKRQPVGEPIEGYFPVVVKPHKFHAVQDLHERNRHWGGRADKFNNVLKRLVYCAYCGGPMHFDDKGGPPKGGKYLFCYNGKRNAGCRNPRPYRPRYDDLLECILNNCPKLKPEQVLPDPDEKSERCYTLREKIRGMESELEDIDRRQNNLADQIADEDDKDIRQRLRNKLHQLNDRTPAIENDIKLAEQQLREAERDSRSFNAWKRDFKQLRESIEGDNHDAIEMRMKFNAHLHELIDRIIVFAEGYPERPNDDVPEPVPTPADANGRVRYVSRPEQRHDSFLEEMEDHIETNHKSLFRDKMFMSFVRHIAKLRHTKKGRFVRVVFKTGAIVELVPEGSLASGMEWVKDNRRRKGWRFVSPKLERMWQDYCTEYRKNANK